jgi:hypothetical protein
MLEDSVRVIGGIEVTVSLKGSPGSDASHRTVTSWIVCLMATRDVVEGTVICPLGGNAPMTRCVDCHLLQALESDWRRVYCATPEP